MHGHAVVYRLHALFLILIASGPVRADLRELNEANSAMKAGFALSDDAAARLAAASGSSSDARARIALLAYYSVSCKTLPVAQIKQRRAEQIFWLIQHAPTSELFNIANGIYRIFLTGDQFADPDAFRQGAALWMKQVEAHPGDRAIQQNASRFLELGDPRAASGLLRDLGNSQAVGSLYGLMLLGVVATDYRTGDSRVTDDNARKSDFAKEAMAELRQSADAKLIGGAGFWMAVQGGMLYADGKLDWDYTGTSHELLRRALELDPTVAQWYALVDQPLPQRGQRPARVFGTSMAGLQARRTRGVTPVYSPDIKAQGIEGKVTLNLLIGPDGKVVKALMTGGPQVFADSVLDAVKQWEYKPESSFTFAPAEVTFSREGVRI